MNTSDKILYFEYILKCLLDWNREARIIQGPPISPEDNDLSILKSLKLLFFVSAARTTSQEHSTLLEDVFDKFYAMPYGHVESDIYDHIRSTKGKLNYFNIDSKKTVVNPDKNLEELLTNLANMNAKAEIDDSISYLKRINPALVLMSPFELVDLSHAWYSWQQYYEEAQKLASKSIEIPTQAIKSEDKIFSLGVF